MAYPTSVFSPATRSNGQTIDAAHVNDVQAEITAVEDALLGTITHSVNITGASTLATLQAAASTFSVRPVTPPPDAVAVHLTDAADLGSSASGFVDWTAYSISPLNSSMHSTTTNPSRLIPQSTGVYLAVAQLAFRSTTGGRRRVAITDSSNNVIADAQQVASSFATKMNISGLKRFDVDGGYVRCYWEQPAGDTQALLSGPGASWMGLTKL